MTEKTLYEEFKHSLPKGLPASSVNNMPRAIVENLAEEYAESIKSKTVKGKEVDMEEEDDTDSFINSLLEESEEEEAKNSLDEFLDGEEEETPEEDEAENEEDEVPEETPPPPVKAKETKVPTVKIKKEKDTRNLENIKIMNVNTLTAAESYNRYLRKVIRSTFLVALPVSGYSANVRGLNIDEVDSIRSSFDDNFEARERIRELAFACIEKSSASFTGYGEFLDGTSSTELDIILFGIMIKTFGSVNQFNTRCSNCGKTHDISVDMNEIVRFDNSESLEQIEKIQSSLNPREEFLRAPLHMSTRVLLPESKMVIDLKVPSLSKEVQSTMTFKNRSENDQSARLFTYLNVTEALFLPYFDRDDDEDFEPIGYTEVTSPAERISYINTISRQDRDKIEEALNDFYKYRVDFKLTDIECTHCKHKNEVIFDINENFIHSIFREM